MILKYDPEILTASSIHKIVLRNQGDLKLDNPCQSSVPDPVEIR